ncbi:2-(1,2-epoxy-1,2-dihydrophenyl)acetyl-CoA isomerase [Sinosporangium album]|uniref:2-(1,2-epoxy-1,2-dihydrophenyl)acetyl-CoA isomerase n=1 Tax=Sinosporangium album TaxID=504805 RepID=A0A1G8B7L5_9ACTN|nr:enoyl-CoA hydratase/isomerase family protein [Sinosporangium album]SDH28993.1 2-(1,2-epoxy-1,2-dihydrophenyl)acetyl-CoA isomerase [Sinosporangium album]
MHNDLANLRIERDGAVAVIGLNRPSKLNAVDLDTLLQFNAALAECEHDESVRAIVLSGEGSSFCAGIDLTALAEERIPRSFFPLWEQTMWLSENLPKPVICAIHGHCIGAGLQLALTCDLRIADARARFALPAAKEGLIPSLSPHRLWRFVGLGRARRMVLFNETWDSPTALDYGLIDEVVDSGREGVLERAVAQAKTFAEDLPTISFAMCKKALSLPRHPDEDLLAGYLADQEVCLTHPDHHKAANEWLARVNGKAGRRT